MAVYELTVLERLDKDSVKSKDGTANEARASVAELMSVLNVNILKHQYDGVKKVAYEIQGEQFAGYDYYEFEVVDSKGSNVCKVIDQLLGSWLTSEFQDVALRWLCVKQLTPEEQKRRAY